MLRKPRPGMALCTPSLTYATQGSICHRKQLGPVGLLQLLSSCLARPPPPIKRSPPFFHKHMSSPGVGTPMFAEVKGFSPLFVLRAALGGEGLRGRPYPEDRKIPAPSLSACFKPRESFGVICSEFGVIALNSCGPGRCYVSGPRGSLCCAS